MLLMAGRKDTENATDISYDEFIGMVTNNVDGKDIIIETKINIYLNFVFNIKITIIRLSNVYGKYSLNKTSFVHLFLKKIKHNQNLNIYGPRVLLSIILFGIITGYSIIGMIIEPLYVLIRTVFDNVVLFIIKLFI